MPFGIGFGEVLLAGAVGLGIAGVAKVLQRGSSPVDKEIALVERLHKAGTLSDAEYESARRKIVDKLVASGAPAPAPQSSAGRTLLGLAGLAAVLWVGSRMFLGTDKTDRIVATVTQTPIEVYNAVENVPASSWRALPFSLPYSGQLTLSINVRSGNALDVFVVPPGEVGSLKSNKTFRTFEGFNASKARAYKRAERLAQGSYYVVLRDQTLGILSHGSSDVEVRARLEP
jgi:hypothetical protein